MLSDSSTKEFGELVWKYCFSSTVIEREARRILKDMAHSAHFAILEPKIGEKCQVMHSLVSTKVHVAVGGSIKQLRDVASVVWERFA